MSVFSNFTNDIVDVMGNLILKRDGSVFALYEIPSHVLNIIQSKKKEDLKNLFSATLPEIKSYMDFDVAMIPFSKELLQNYKKLSRDFASDTEDTAWYITENAYAYLNGSLELSEYKYYMSIPLKSYHITVDLKEVVKNAVETTTSAISEFFGYETNVYEGWEQNYEKQEEALRKKLSLLDAIPLTRKQNLFVNHYVNVRSRLMEEAKVLPALQNNVENLTETSVTFEDLNILKFHTDYGSHYTVYLPVARTPENMSYLHPTEAILSLGFPVEFFTKAKFARTKGNPINNVRSKGRRARGRLKSTQQESSQAGSVGKKAIARSKYLVEKMEEKIDEGTSMISSLQTIIISDLDKEVLKQKINMTMETFKARGIFLSRDSAGQLYYMEKMRFGEVLDGQDKNFVQIVEEKAFAENLFFINRKVGQDVGFYFAKVDNQINSWHGDFKRAVASSDIPVYINPFQANKQGVKGKETSNPHIQVSGDTGFGKSFAVSYIHFYSSLLNCQTLYIDPKCEKRDWYMRVLKEYEKENVYPEIQSYIRSINFVTLNHTQKENHGALDPLVFLEYSQAKDLIVSMIDEFHSLEDEKRFKKALLETIRDFSGRRARGEKVGTLSVIKELAKSEITDVKETAELLVEEIEDSILSLVFSDGQNDAVDLLARNTILEVRGLDLPADEKATLSLQNKKSLVVMYALGHFCIAFGERDYGVETMEVFDEAWFMSMTAYGRGLVDKIKRVGRSQNNFLVYVSQEPDDSNKADGGASAFGTYLCFYNDAEDASEKILKRLKMPVTDESKKWFNNMTQAQCLFKDTHGRVERITIDGLFPEVNRLFQTVKSDMEAVGSEKEVA